MLEFNWTEIFSFLFLIHLVQCQETSGQVPYFTVKADGEVTLPCLNVINTQTECNRTTWHFTKSRDSPVVELVQHGLVGNTAKADRLNVTTDCSLTIKKVTLEDVGQYSCRQYDGSIQNEYSDTVVDLSVINIHEHQDNDEVMLTCSVLTYEGCAYKVEWLYDRDKYIIRNLKTSHSLCSASLTFNTHLDQNIKKPKCKVTDNNGNSFLPDNFSQQEKDEETDTPHWWFYIIVAVSAALIILVVVIMRQRRIKGKSNKTKKDDSLGLSFDPAVIQPASETSQVMADTEEDVSYASVSYAKKTNGKAKGKDDDDDNEEEDAVTYSSVKTSPEASNDPSSIYATVNKSNKKEKVTV